MRDQFLAAFKRAARVSPLHSEVIIYQTATDGTGAALVDAGGRFIYREHATTYGYLDLEAEAEFTVPESPYAGAVSISVQYPGPIDLRHLIRLGGTLYAVEAVKGGDSVGLSVKVAARAMTDAADYTLLGPDNAP